MNIRKLVKPLRLVTVRAFDNDFDIYCMFVWTVIEVAVGEYGNDIQTLVDAANRNHRPNLPHGEQEISTQENGGSTFHSLFKALLYSSLYSTQDCS